MPIEDATNDLYRCVTEHGGFGIHNMTIEETSPDHVGVTSLYDWETGCIVPAFLADPVVPVSQVDLTLSNPARHVVACKPSDNSPADLKTYRTWSDHYFEQLFTHAPVFQIAIERGSAVRILWVALRDCRGEEPDNLFGVFGTWAENRIAKLSA
jgi:hypothetical protein